MAVVKRRNFTPDMVDSMKVVVDYYDSTNSCTDFYSAHKDSSPKEASQNRN